MKYKEIPLEYKWNIMLPSFDVGPNRLMTPSAILRMQQEVGGIHLHGTRAELEALIADKVAFLSIQSRVKVTRLPKISENFSITTWARDIKRARFFRCYKGVDAFGQPLFDGITSFVYVNYETHKILRPNEFNVLGIPHNEERRGDCPDPEKLRLPEGLVESPLQRRVMWSDTDWNGHLNNTVYADIIFDYIPSEIREHRLDEFTISFISECRLDEVLIISTLVEEIDGGYQVWVRGEVERCSAAEKPHLAGANSPKLERIKCFEGLVNFIDKADNRTAENG